MYITAGSSDILSVFFIQLIISVTPIVADVGLYFVKSPEPFAAPLNDEVIFECSLNVPAEIIRWRHGRKYIQNRTTSRTSTNNQLVIKVENDSQLGDYQCVAQFGASALASVPAKLSLADIKPFALQPNRQHTVTVGNIVSIFCPPPISNPSALIQYFLDGKKLSSQHTLTLPTSNSLLLKNVSLQDSGTYTCSATNYITTQTFMAPFHVNLKVVPRNFVEPHAPKFLYPPQTNYIVQSGSNVTIECVAVGEPPPTVRWRKVGYTQLLPPNRTEILVGGLHLRNIVPEDTGEYVCEMSNGIEPPLEHKILLHIHEAPVILKEPNRTLVEEHGDTELSCEVSGNPIPTVNWTFNGESVENDSHITVLSSKIIIKRVQKRHSGIYQCFATNTVGCSYGSAMLQVSPKQIISNSSEIFEQEDGWTEGGRNNRSGMPGNRGRGHSYGKKEHPRKNKSKRKHKESVVMVPPTMPNVTRLSDRSVMVRWQVPHNDGLPISFFKVQYKEVPKNSSTRGKSGRWMTSNEDIPPHIRSYEVDRLETNRTYKFRIAAVYSNNDNKLSPSSSRFYLHQGVPTERSGLVSPIILNTGDATMTSIEIQWQYLNSALTPVDGFYIYYRATTSAGEYEKATVEGEQTRSYVITHLQPDMAYDIKIQSFTVGAASDFSSIISRKTLPDPTLPTTEPTNHIDTKIPNVSILPASSSNTFQLLIVFGGILLVLVIMFSIFVLIFFVKQRWPSEHSNDDENTPDKNTDNIMTIHQVEPVTMNGYANHNSHNNHNNKLINGSLKSCNRNGYITPHPPINITNNPLSPESKHEKNAMEMSYLSKHNNNCPIDACVDSDGDCGREVKLSVDRTKWKLREQRPGEKYV